MFTQWKLFRAHAYYRRLRGRLVGREKLRRSRLYANIRSDRSECIAEEKMKASREIKRDVERQLHESGNP